MGESGFIDVCYISLGIKGKITDLSKFWFIFK